MDSCREKDYFLPFDLRSFFLASLLLLAFEIKYFSTAKGKAKKLFVKDHRLKPLHRSGSSLWVFLKILVGVGKAVREADLVIIVLKRVLELQSVLLQVTFYRVRIKSCKLEIVFVCHVNLVLTTTNPANLFLFLLPVTMAADLHAIFWVVEALLFFEVDYPELDRLPFFSVGNFKIKPLCVSRAISIRHHLKVVASLAVFHNDE